MCAAHTTIKPRIKEKGLGGEGKSLVFQSYPSSFHHQFIHHPIPSSISHVLVVFLFAFVCVCALPCRVIRGRSCHCSPPFSFASLSRSLGASSLLALFVGRIHAAHCDLTANVKRSTCVVCVHVCASVWRSLTEEGLHFTSGIYRSRLRLRARVWV